MSDTQERATEHKCWSCKVVLPLGEFRDNDGYCPECMAEQGGDDDYDGASDGYRGESW